MEMEINIEQIEQVRNAGKRRGDLQMHDTPVICKADCMDSTVETTIRENPNFHVSGLLPSGTLRLPDLSAL